MRTPVWLMLYGIYLYFCCTSFVRASRALEPFIKRSYVAIWKWVQRFSSMADRFRVERGKVKCILVDETSAKIKGVEAWVWVAVEPYLKCFLGFYVTWSRSNLSAYLFLKELRRRYGRKPIYTDDASWYPLACKWLKLEHHVFDDEWKEFMERMNQYLKDRTECFDDLFPCFKEGCKREHVNNWLTFFIYYHNYVRNNEEEGKPPLGDTSKPEHLRFIDMMMEVMTLS
ncbi:MAG: DDE-type integrase/transposase/recombinase [Nitrososphaerales archaeon]